MRRDRQGIILLLPCNNDRRIAYPNAAIGHDLTDLEQLTNRL